MPGRPLKPTHLKLVTGTARPSRINKNEPKMRREIPSAPAHLSDGAKESWGYVAVILDEMGVLTRADRVALEGLCEAYTELRAARKSLADAGSITYETTNATGGKMIRPRPELAMIADADRRLMAWLTKFGLTPADRSRVSAANGSEANAFADLG